MDRNKKLPSNRRPFMPEPIDIETGIPRVYLIIAVIFSIAIAAWAVWK